MNDIQMKILEIMKYVDALCRGNKIQYCIMGGTALGAVRHGGFIPWDDDIDIFMTYSEYQKFVKAFELKTPEQFVLQEWRIVKDYLQYAKVRMNGTTFIEKQFIRNNTLHQGIYIDIMILHKIPKNSTAKLKKQYFVSKYLTLKGNLKTGWKPKKASQKLPAFVAKLVPKFIDKLMYKQVYRYDNLTSDYDYIYYITKANIEQGYFDYNILSETVDIKFEDTTLLAPQDITKYLSIRYGDYMKLPPIEEQQSIQHAEYADANVDYSEYLRRLGK